MVKSMTGFGRGDSQLGDKYFQVELKSVNHRYTDISIKLPKKFTYLEENIRKIIKTHIQRGRVEVYITYQNIGESDVKINVDMALAEEYLEALLKIKNNLKVNDDITTSLIARYPDIINVEKKEENEEELWQCLEKSLNVAINQLISMRKEEGSKLKSDLINRLNKTKKFVEEVKERSPIIVQEYRQKLKERIKEISNEEFLLDDSRLAAEVALFADKSNITEEVVRLYSHIEQFKNILNDDDIIGRKLDFLLQEMNREVNTIGSKANDLNISNLVINIKSELEKMREQVQNIE